MTGGCGFDRMPKEKIQNWGRAKIDRSEDNQNVRGG